MAAIAWITASYWERVALHMKTLDGFSKGMGIGGWLTNYKRFNVLPQEWRLQITVGDLEHFETYITDDDVVNIRNMGMDHVRVGFDQIVMEERPYVYRDRMFALLEHFICCCQENGLRVVLNLHKAIGNYCDIEEAVTIFESEELQNRFIALWMEFEKRFSGYPNVMFELLNEVRDVNPADWNRLAEKTVAALRTLNTERIIIVGSVCWNSARKLYDLQLFEDENVIYTFHMYEPDAFTHQRGVLRPKELFYNRHMKYPDSADPYREFGELVGDPYYAGLTCERIDMDYLRTCLQGAVDFVKNHPDKILWAGEFGTIRHANMTYRENWMRDVITIFKELDIPYCVWNYLSTPNDGNRFSLVDDDTRKILSEEMLHIINGNV